MSVGIERAHAFKPVTLATAASSGITLATPSVVSNVKNYFNGYMNRTELTIAGFSFATTAAAKAIGQKIFTFPEGFIIPVAARIQMSTTAADNATAGEVGLGTVVGSGANATLGAVGATSENIMEGTTLSNHTAATALTSNKCNMPVIFGTQGATAPSVIDGSATAADCFLNIASTFSGTGGFTFTSGTVVVDWIWMGDV